MNKRLITKLTAAAAAAILSVSALSSSGILYTADYEGELASLEQRRAALTEEREKLEAELNEYLEGAEQQEEYLALYDEKMKVQEEEMDNLTEQIALLNTQLEELDKKIAEKQAEVDDGVEEFRERLRVIYMSGGDGVAEILAGSSSFYDILARMEMVQRISKHDNDMISALCDKIEELNDDKTALENQRAALDEKKNEQMAVLEKLRETYANHEETKKWYEEKAAAQAEMTDELKAQEAAAEEELQDFIRKQQEEIAAKMAEKKKKQQAEKAAQEETVTVTEAPVQETAPPETTVTEVTTAYENLFPETEAAPEDDYDVYSPDSDDDEFDVTATTVTEREFVDPYDTYEWGKTYYPKAEDTDQTDSSDTSGSGYGTSSVTGFIWPVPTVRNMTDGYGERYIVEEGSSDFHKGIDINKPGCQGEAIVASAGGVVITASDTGNGYGVHVVIDHGDNIATLYGHMSSTTVSVGDEVQQGQIIGYIGNTGYAYGYHCHFEVRVNGQHTDPLNYVDVNN
ncbi:MAG: peptidoglycan DD-metalloendopeptidase family protein [Oscillospiraceae bacterium]|nr:peptidoglycan DD-metalloendopeptidase family protein [Oscillospiraceae bacterium]